MLDGTTEFTPDATMAGDKESPSGRVTTDRAARFPYVGLEDCVLVARAVFDHGAAALSYDQLASAMKMAPESSTFQIRLISARMFGLIDTSGSRVRLTELGSLACSSDDIEQRQARRDAFLEVPLYSKAFAELRGKPLPPRPHGLEERFVSFGVTPKQKDKARRAFENSANYAGFFAGGRDRLIEPILAPSSAAKPAAEARDDTTLGGSSETPHQKLVDATRDPLIHGLLIRLPPPGTEWPHDKRVQWLRVLASNLDIVYPAPSSEGGEPPYIRISAEPS